MARHHPTVYAYTSSEKIAALYDSAHGSIPLFSFDTAYLDSLFKAPGALADLGCGTGRHVLHFARRGFAVTGVDMSEHMLKACAGKLEGEGLSARLVKGDILEMPFLETGSFDCAIMMFSTLGLVKGSAQRLAALKEAWRILRPGGIFAAHVHNRSRGFLGHWGVAGLFRGGDEKPERDWEAGDKIMENYQGVLDLYLHTFTLREMRGLFRGAGFRVADEVCLNERRDGRLSVPLRALFANGFILAGEKPVGA